MREPGLQAQRQLLSPCAVAPQRCRIGRGDRDVETGARTGPIRQMRRALHAGGKPARRNLRVDVEVAERTPAQHETGASGTFLQIDPAPEPQQPSKLRPLVGREPFERACLQLEAHGAVRRAEQRAHAPAEFQRCTTQIADREAIQHESGRVIAQLEAGILRGDAGEDRAIDIGREQQFAGEIRLGSGKDRRRQHRELVQVELRGLELQLEPSRLAVERIDVDETTAELLAVYLRLEPLDRNTVGAEHEFAARAQRDRKSTRLNSSHEWISYAVFCLKKKKKTANNNLVLKNKKKKKNI